MNDKTSDKKYKVTLTENQLALVGTAVEGMMNDLISRQAAIDATWFEPSYTDPLNVLTEVRDRLKALPSAQPKQRWIPCSERLPEAPGFVNCTCHSLIDNREDWVVETFYMPHPSGSPYSDWGNIPMLNDGKCEVVAWMYRNIPEPYKAETEREE